MTDWFVVHLEANLALLPVFQPVSPGSCRAVLPGAALPDRVGRARLNLLPVADVRADCRLHRGGRRRPGAGDALAAISIRKLFGAGDGVDIVVVGSPCCRPVGLAAAWGCLLIACWAGQPGQAAAGWCLMPRRRRWPCCRCRPTASSPTVYAFDHRPGRPDFRRFLRHRHPGLPCRPAGHGQRRPRPPARHRAGQPDIDQPGASSSGCRMVQLIRARMAC